MTLLAPSAPLLTVAHDWTSPPERTATAPTAILSAEDGSEQRLSLGGVVTETLTYRLLAPSYGDAAQLKALLDNATDALVRVPRWEDQARIPDGSSVLAGDSTIPCDPSNKPTFVAGSEVLLWRSASSYEVAVIDTVGGASIDVVDPLASGWAAGTTVVPISEARVVLPITLTHWVPTSGALDVAFTIDVRDLAGLGTGGTAITATVGSMAIAWRTAPSLLYYGSRAVLAVEAFDAAGNPLTGVPVVWTSGDPDAAIWATVDPMVAVVEGRRTAGPFPNDVTLTATVGSVSVSKVMTCWA